MAGNLRLYTYVYIALLGLAFSKFLFFEFLAYWTAMGLTMITAAMKTGLIVAYFQHLKWEPRSISYLMLSSLAAVLLLAVAATYSIT